MDPTLARCKNCGSDDKNMSIDARHGHYVCIVCGVVQSRLLVSDVAPQAVVQYEERGTSSDRRHLRKWSRQVDTLVDGRNCRLDRRYASIKHIVYQVGFTENLATEAFGLLRRHINVLGDMAPKLRVDCICVIIAARRKGLHVDVQRMESALGVTRTDQALKTVCHELKINSRTKVMDGLNRVMTHLKFEHKWLARVKRLYKLMCAKHPSMGPATRMSLCVYRAHLDRLHFMAAGEEKDKLKRLTIDFVTHLVGSSTSSTKVFLTGKKKCLLFTDTYQVCEPRRV